LAGAVVVVTGKVVVVTGKVVGGAMVVEGGGVVAVVRVGGTVVDSGVSPNW
jgi:hypothetical protein